MAYLVAVLGLVQVLDSFSASYTATFPSKVIEEFLPNWPTNDADALMSLVFGASTFGLYFVFVNQYLADRVGRKPVLALTTLGMGASALLLSLSWNVSSFGFFLFVSLIFVGSDLWLVYVTEEAPAERRGLYTNVVMILGILGALVIPVVRGAALTDDSPPGAWRLMTIFPVALGFPLAALVAFSVKETSVFSSVRPGPPDPGEGLATNLRKLASSKQFRQLAVVCFMSLTLGLNYLLLQLGESYASTTIGLSDRQVNAAISVVAVAVVGTYAVVGILSDGIGRRPLAYAFSAVLPLGCLFMYLASGAASPTGAFSLVVAGICLAYVGHNGLQVLFRIVTSELAPTEVRGTAGGLRGFVQSVGMTLGFFTGGALVSRLGLGLTFVVLGLPTLANLVLLAKVGETRGADLSRVE
ncbi:MAG: MFS transporter [Promethearchaeota archaeon]